MSRLPLSTEFENIVSDYSDPKKKLLYYLKVMQKARLQELAKSMKISKMAVHKHLTQLQKRGLVESIEIREGVGRPKMQYSLTSRSKTIFPKSYGALAVCALDFIEKKMGKDGVKKVLQERQGELFNKYFERLKKLNFDQKVKELAKIRDEEGYIAESKKNSRKNGLYTLLEYNCPILDIAQNHWEACSTETELFEKLLGAKIETTHRAAKGDMVCKFLIKEKKENYL
jgi:predicted ArsR family transcriptional regulator